MAGAVTVDTVAAVGARVLVYIGLKWHGGFVESIEAASGKRLIVFDDGDLRWVTNSDIRFLNAGIARLSLLNAFERLVLPTA